MRKRSSTSSTESGIIAKRASPRSSSSCACRLHRARGRRAGRGAGAAPSRLGGRRRCLVARRDLARERVLAAPRRHGRPAADLRGVHEPARRRAQVRAAPLGGLARADREPEDGGSASRARARPSRPRTAGASSSRTGAAATSGARAGAGSGSRSAVVATAARSGRAGRGRRQPLLVHAAGVDLTGEAGDPRRRRSSRTVSTIPIRIGSQYFFASRIARTQAGELRQVDRGQRDVRPRDLRQVDRGERDVGPRDSGEQVDQQGEADQRGGCLPGALRDVPERVEPRVAARKARAAGLGGRR